MLLPLTRRLRSLLVIEIFMAHVECLRSWDRRCHKLFLDGTLTMLSDEFTLTGLNIPQILGQHFLLVTLLALHGQLLLAKALPA